MEQTTIRGISKPITRVGLGTWAIGGWMWGGSKKTDAIATIRRALDLGINLIDTAPIYGFGVAEEIVGEAIAGRRDEVVLATKFGLTWEGNQIDRDSSPANIKRELELSLKRLKTDVIDLYQVHWPDNAFPFAETAEALQTLKKEGKIRAIGVSNFLVDMLEAFGEVDAFQPPYNLFEREVETAELPYCKQHGIAVLGYGVLCRGLLSGKMSKERRFEGDDLRKRDPKFQEPRFAEYLRCVGMLEAWAEERYQKPVTALAVRYALDRGIDIPLWGCRKQEQLDALSEVWGWQLSGEELAEIDAILEIVSEPIGPEFIGRPR